MSDKMMKSQFQHVQRSLRAHSALSGHTMIQPTANFTRGSASQLFTETSASLMSSFPSLISFLIHIFPLPTPTLLCRSTSRLHLSFTFKLASGREFCCLWLLGPQGIDFIYMTKPNLSPHTAEGRVLEVFQMKSWIITTQTMYSKCSFINEGSIR